MYTAPDFKEYIVANSGKDVTRGQISGAVSQLVDTKEIVRVERGLFAKDMKVTVNKKKRKITKCCWRDNTLEKMKLYNKLKVLKKDIDVFYNFNTKIKDAIN